MPAGFTAAGAPYDTRAPPRLASYRSPLDEEVLLVAPKHLVEKNNVMVVVRKVYIVQTEPSV